MAIYRDKYDYTVSSLLHDAGRHRPNCEPNSYNCRCEDDHVVELQLVVAALNKLPEDTYTGSKWQATLVDFFDKKYRNWEFMANMQSASGEGESSGQVDSSSSPSPQGR